MLSAIVVMTAALTARAESGVYQGDQCDSDRGPWWSQTNQVGHDYLHPAIFLKMFSIFFRSEEEKKSIVLSSSHSEPGFNLQQMLQSIGASQGVPPFLKSLASSLQLLQLQQSTQTTTSNIDASCDTNTAAHDTSTAAHGGTGANIPRELSQMMDAFKEMRPPPPPATDSTTDSEAINGVREEASSCHGDDGQVNKHIAKLLEERLSELENRLQGYVDAKMAELEKKLAMKLDKLSGRVDMLNQQSQNTKLCNIESNGVPLSEDQQLD